LSDCLRFLREKTDQISGVRDRGDEAILPEDMYRTFLRRLQAVLPPNVIDSYVQESLRPEGAALSMTERNRLKLASSRHRSRKPKMLDGRENKVGEESLVGSISSSSGSGGSTAKCSSSSTSGAEPSTKGSFTFGFSI
jgi:hypothetical protein